jgi:hypothetical protein
MCGREKDALLIAVIFTIVGLIFTFSGFLPALGLILLGWFIALPVIIEVHDYEKRNRRKR